MERCRRMISAVLLLALVCSLLSGFSLKAEVASTLVSTSFAPGTTAAEVEALFSARSENQHPRIFADADKFAQLRQQIQTDEYSRVLYARMYGYCVAQLSEPVSVYKIPDGLRLLSVSRTASARIIWLSMMYQLSGERRFAERAVAEMLAVSAFSDWNHAKHYLDVGTFVMEAMGERWIMDLGSDEYNLLEYGKFNNGYKETIGRWTYYRKRTEGHNTLVINPGTRGGQDVDAKCQIVDYKSSYDGGYATVDMTDAYDNDGDG